MRAWLPVSGWGGARPQCTGGLWPGLLGWGDLARGLPLQTRSSRGRTSGPATNASKHMVTHGWYLGRFVWYCITRTQTSTVRTQAERLGLHFTDHTVTHRMSESALKVSKHTMTQSVVLRAECFGLHHTQSSTARMKFQDRCLIESRRHASLQEKRHELSLNGLPDHIPRLMMMTCNPLGKELGESRTAQCGCHPSPAWKGAQRT
jgi:hypothetical protein